MSQNIDIKKTTESLKSLIKHARQYASFVLIIAVLGMYSFLVFQISTFSQKEPSDDEITQSTTVKRLKIDQDSIDKILQLQDQNIGVKAIFQQARSNPFED